jgi:hypothetical protein
LSDSARLSSWQAPSSCPFDPCLVPHNPLLPQLTDDEPRLFLNIEDYLFYAQGRKSNNKFKAVVAYLRSSPTCGHGGLNGTGARLHWGKAGWPDVGCWHGDVEYPGTWCDFGCAKRALDPTGKFSDNAPDR